jgi:DNA-binding transcriptional regulator WhiA
MARRWTTEEENLYRDELVQFYVIENKTIREVGEILELSEKTVYDRLKRLDIPTNRLLKPGINNQRTNVKIPERSVLLAEFFGIMLGDGHVAQYQTFVTLGTKEYPYVCYVQKVMTELFGIKAHISTKKSDYHDVYIGSIEITKWLKDQGLVSNKVAAQVGVPPWIFSKPEYMRAFIRGFFDTDGSVYKLKSGIQISITNHSLPLLIALQSMFRTLGYSVSKISVGRIYITRREEVARFFEEIAPMNSKHRVRFEEFMRRSDSGYSRRL